MKKIPSCVESLRSATLIWMLRSSLKLRSATASFLGALSSPPTFLNKPILVRSWGAIENNTSPCNFHLTLLYSNNTQILAPVSGITLFHRNKLADNSAQNCFCYKSVLTFLSEIWLNEETTKATKVNYSTIHDEYFNLLSLYAYTRSWESCVLHYSWWLTTFVIKFQKTSYTALSTSR